MQKFILILLTLLSLVQISCKKNDRSSILIIAVDKLAMTDVTCGQEEKLNSGLQLLCSESVRFTHAFTPSTLSVPALASTLTGLYPYQHKVRHNGGPGLAAEMELASEVALEQDYRTSFFSGGPPVFRRNGLNQGFELFDDNLIPSLSALFRPFKKTSENFISWLSQEVEGTPFFSMIYAPDLLFTTTESMTNLGEVRNLSFESQLDELDESLFDLFVHLKTHHIWDNTTIFLIGLNGHSNDNRMREISPTNLHGENTQVALLIKPAQKKKRDEAITWKIDQNVSLVDVGRTLLELLGESVVDDVSASFPSHSLLELLKNPNNTWSPERPLLIESGWALWRQAGPLRMAAVAGPVFYIHDEKPLLYNTLLDRFESNPLPLLQESILPITQKIQYLMLKNNFPSFKFSDWDRVSKLEIPYARWMRTDQEGLLLSQLKRQAAANSTDLVLAQWVAQIALSQKDWVTLRTLGIKYKMSIWQFVAERNLNVKDTKFNDSCLQLLYSKTLEAENLKACSDPLFLELVDWFRADTRGLVRETQKTRFERSFRGYMLDQFIQRSNIAAGLIWDTSQENIFAPSKTELALHLPEYAKTRAQLYKSLQTQD